MNNPPAEERALIPGGRPGVEDDENNINIDININHNINNSSLDVLQIQDEAEWFRRYGLSGAPHYGDESYANQQEAKRRVQDQFSYQEKVHEQIFKESAQRDNDQQCQRQTKLDEWKSDTITLLVTIDEGGTATIECNVKALASHSDTVFAMALSRELYSSMNSTSTTEHPPLSLSLENYSKQTVEAFLQLVVRVDTTTTTNGNTAADDSITTIITEELSIHPEYIVDCCRIAHYLQCTQLLDSIVQILQASVDSANCMSICQLADQLHLPALLEASLGHMMRSLGGLIEDHSIWGDLTPELQGQITGIQSILQSSNRRQLFFSSFTEYLAMFAEQVEYYRERLTEAKMQQEQHKHLTSPAAYDYAQEKLDRQTERVRILQLVFAEQKKLFRNKPDFLYKVQQPPPP
jgi:hypothetical protein